MYEFDEEYWDRWDDMEELQAEQLGGITEGWLIESLSSQRRRFPASDEPRYLQLATGQWCGARYATLFPLYSTAILYAQQYGYVVGESVRIVKHRF